MALSEPFSIGPEQGEVHRNVGLLIVRQPRVDATAVVAQPAGEECQLQMSY
jgi:hypothetical protein